MDESSCATERIVTVIGSSDEEVSEIREEVVVWQTGEPSNILTESKRRLSRPSNRRSLKRLEELR